MSTVNPPLIKSYDLRMSFIWVSTILDFLKGNVPAGAPMAFLGNEGQYKNKFDQMVAQLGQGQLQPPWFKAKEDFFWYYHTENTEPVNITSTKAWKYFIPMRMRIPFKVGAPLQKGRTFLEGFFYPFGVALVFTVECYDELTLDEARELAFKIKQGDSLQVTFPDGSTQDLHLNPLADRALAFLYQTALGPHAKSTYPVSPLFSIWTVVRGEGVDPKTATPDGKEVHRILEAVTTWNPNFATGNLPKLATVSAQLRKQRSAADVLYANDRGRAVWFPGTFTLPEGPKRSLACYHRNLIYASMEVESLCRFVRQTAQEIKVPGDGSKLPAQHYACAKRAAGILARLYLALKDQTYRSGSPYMQIRQNNFLNDINKVRDETLSGGKHLV